jgi:hypothetical protein
MWLERHDHYGLHDTLMSRTGSLQSVLAADHARLDLLLANCLSEIDEPSYAAFRSGLLRHIGIEERILFPELRKRRGVTPLEQQLHRDHAALAALLVPPPTPRELHQIVEILQPHNAAEEGVEGLYDLIDTMCSGELPSLLERVQTFPEIPVAPHADTPLVRATIERLVRDAAEGRRLFRV